MAEQLEKKAAVKTQERQKTKTKQQQKEKTPHSPEMSSQSAAGPDLFWREEAGLPVGDRAVPSSDWLRWEAWSKRRRRGKRENKASMAVLRRKQTKRTNRGMKWAGGWRGRWVRCRVTGGGRQRRDSKALKHSLIILLGLFTFELHTGFSTRRHVDNGCEYWLLAMDRE